MSPVTGAGAASSDPEGNGGTSDQTAGIALQQVQILPGGEFGVATVAAVSTTATTSSALTTYVAATFTATTTSTSATASVGKGDSGGRSDKGKGPASKHCATGSILTATSVHSASASSNPELSATTSSITTAARTEDLDFGIILNSVVAAARSYHAAARVADARVSSAAAAAARAHDRAASTTDPDPARARASARSMDSYARSVAARAADAHAAAAAADYVVAQARAFAASLVVDQDRAADSSVTSLDIDFGVILNSVVTTARNCHAAAAAAAARANFAADARANFDASARAAVFTPDTDSNATRARARARARSRARDVADRVAAARVAAARAAAVAADHVVAQAHAFAADLGIVQDRAADSCVPITGPDSDPISNSAARAAAVAIAASSLRPDPSFLLPPGCVDLFGFVVHSEFREVVSKLISDVCALAESFYLCMVEIPASDALRGLSNTVRCAWCLINKKFYEAKFVAKCFAACCANLLPEFIKHLCSVKVWDSSSRCFFPLMGNSLRDFWTFLDQAIFRAVGSFFVAKWSELAMNFSVSFFSQLEPGEGLSALCGGDFVDACAKAGTSSSSCFDSITGGMGVHVSPHGGDSVDLFGLEVLPEIRGMFDVLICEISTLARRTYSSVIRAQVMDALSRLSGYEQCAWLTTNMMLYKTSFVANCLAEYYDSLCPGFIYSLFSVRPGCTSGRGLLSLIGKDLGNFWLRLSDAIVEAVESIFVENWGRLTSLFSVSLGPVEGSSSTVLSGEDFINARRRVGLPAVAVSGMKGRVAQIAVSHADEAANGSSAAGLSGEEALVVDVSAHPTPEVSALAREEVGLSMVGTSSPLGVLGDGSSSSTSERMVVLTTSASSFTSVEIKESPTLPVSASLYGPKKSFMSRHSAGETSSIMLSSMSSSNSVAAAGSLSSASVGMGSVSSVVTTTTTTTAAAYTYSGEGDIGVRLAALMNRGLPPSPPPASESTPTEGEASSSSRGSGRGRRKRKRKS